MKDDGDSERPEDNLKWKGPKKRSHHLMIFLLSGMREVRLMGLEWSPVKWPRLC